MEHFDVVIIGGGMAGATTALSIKRTLPQSKIAVVEAHQPKSTVHPSFDDRSIALAAQSVEYLTQLGLFHSSWSFAEPIKEVAVSDRGHFGKAWITHQEYQVDALGYVIEVNPFGAFLHQQLESYGIKVLCPRTVMEINQTEKQVEVTLDNQETLHGRLLVIADGIHSHSRTLLNIGFPTEQYEQGAVIANVKMASNHQGRAFERFTEHGPMALLPMSDNRYSLVWCLENAVLDEYVNLDDDEFLAALQSAFGFRAGEFVQAGKRSAYPLVLGRAERLTHHRTVILGNAAHAIHPIAGQGFNLGLRDIQALVKLLELEKTSEWGSHSFTQAYERTRAGDVKRVMTLTDALVRLFSNRSRTLALGRSIGLLSMSFCEEFKAPLANQLMGRV